MRPRIHSVVPRGSGVEVVHGALRDNIPGYSMAHYSPKLEYFPMMLRRYHRTDVDLLHMPADHAVFLAASDVPLAITFHNYVLDAWMRRYSSPVQKLHYATDLRFFIKQALHKADSVTAVSKFTAELVGKDLGYDADIRVIPNGVDEGLFRPQNVGRRDARGKVRVLFSGNPTRRKGVQWLKEIADQLPAQVELLVTQGLRMHGKTFSSSSMYCVGAIPHKDMPTLYRDVDMVLSCTVREGMPLSIIEAMACGLPVIASDCSSLPELIDHGKGGFLCGVGDVPGFVERIGQLADSPSLCREMGQYNRHKVESCFTLSGMIDAYRLLFDEML